MKRIYPFVLAVMLAASALHAATSYTEFYCASYAGATNINSGHTTNAQPRYLSVNGNWDPATGIFLPTDLTNPTSSNVVVGDFASVYIDNATTAVFVGRVTAVDATSITVSTTIKTGTAPTVSATARSIRVGGAWYGPWYSGATVDNLPFNFVNSLLTNTSQNSTRVNLKNDRIYATTNVTHASNGPIRFQGHTLTPGDLGRSWITGSPAGIGHVMLTLSGANCDFADFVFATNGTTATSTLMSMGGTESTITRCVFRDARGLGLDFSSQGTPVEVEAFLCNAGGLASGGGIKLGTAGTTAIRCISHDNAGANSSGFIMSANATLIDCIADSNGRDGALISSTAFATIKGCDFYNNTSNGVNLTSASAMTAHIENSNFILNGAYGINSAGSLLRNGNILNCGFGSGSQANGGGTILAGTGFDEIGTVTYASNVTPWTDPANGDFRISLAAAQNAGRGTFTETQSGYAGTVGYPDIGAAQATNSATSGNSLVIMFGR